MDICDVLLGQIRMEAWTTFYFIQIFYFHIPLKFPTAICLLLINLVNYILKSIFLRVFQFLTVGLLLFGRDPRGK